ncbi:thioesterase, FlK family [Bradyrhizobium erythrophlei]|uniref:thioesterase, FlK family n=1 Tax=Bradyrhizobium erythrophlei TaxID=1437360 RepID=UPI003CC80361
MRALARVVDVEAKSVMFQVEAWNERTRIGDGTHRRGIVLLQEFERRFGVGRGRPNRAGVDLNPAAALTEERDPIVGGTSPSPARAIRNASAIGDVQKRSTTSGAGRICTGA